MADLLDQIADNIKREEGFIDIAKDDWEGRVVGYGLNSLHPDADTLLAAQGLTPALVWTGAQPVNKVQAENILTQIISDQQADLAKIHNKSNPYDLWPDEAKIAANDMLYVLGADRYLDFNRYRAAADTGDWAKAGSEVLNSAWTSQLKAVLSDETKRVRTERIAARLNRLDGEVRQLLTSEIDPSGFLKKVLGLQSPINKTGFFNSPTSIQLPLVNTKDYVNDQARAKKVKNIGSYPDGSFAGADIKALLVMPDDTDRIAIIADYLERFEQHLLNNEFSEQRGDRAIDIAAEEAYNEFSESYTSLYNFLYLINLQTITVSTFRSKRQVRALGQVNPRGFARGSRTSAGTMILTEFDRDAFWHFIRNCQPLTDTNIGDGGAPVLIDQIAPFDVILLFQNEQGLASYRYIHGLEISTNGVVYSIQDMYNENTLSFVCRDVTPLTPIVDRFEVQQKIGEYVLGSGGRIGGLTKVQSAKEIARRYRQDINTQNPFR